MGILRWFEDRTGICKFLRSLLFENIPGGPRWRYVWGSTVLFALLVEFITGTCLWLTYSAGATSAWESVYHIETAMPGGELLRGIHRWTADIMVVLIFFHIIQIIIDRAYRAPREFTFWLILLSIGLILAIARTGYLLPWDQEGLWGTKVAMSYVDKAPVIGQVTSAIAIGGGDYGQATLTRFLAFHVGILPALLLVVLALRYYLFRRNGFAAATGTPSGVWGYVIAAGLGALTVLSFIYPDPSAGWLPWVVAASFIAAVAAIVVPRLRKVGSSDAGGGVADAALWPGQLLRNLLACAAFLVVVFVFIAWKGTSLASPADPAQPFSASRPDWYFMSLFTMLKFKPFAGEFGTLLGAVLVPGMIAAVFFAMPFIGKRKIGHWFNVAFLYLFLGAFVWLTYYGFAKDANNPDHHAAVERAEADAERTMELVRANGGIPPEGALTLLYADPLTQGPRLFAQNCASCHPYGGHDGTGAELSDEPSAPDMKGVGSREWIAGMLTLEGWQSAHYFGNTAFKDGKMADSLEDLEMGEGDIEALSAALSSEAKLRSQAGADASDSELIETGFEWMGEDELACVDCHKVRGEGSKKAVDLTGYMSRDWLIEFIGNPAHDKFYGEDNDRMPSYLDVVEEDGSVTAGKLDRRRVGLIVDWLRGEWPSDSENTEPDTPEPEPDTTE